MVRTPIEMQDRLTELLSRIDVAGVGATRLVSDDWIQTVLVLLLVAALMIATVVGFTVRYAIRHFRQPTDSADSRSRPRRRPS